MKKAPEPVDRLVGQNIRIFRKAKGLSQTALGDGLGVTFQQIQKYENGVNRVGSGRLAKIAQVLDVPVSRFFHNRTTKADGDDGADAVTDLLSSPYALRMLKALSRISDSKVQLSLVSLTETVADRE